MSKKNRIKKLSGKNKGRQISAQATPPLESSTDNENPSFRFTYTDKNRWILSDWNPSEINDLIEGLKKIEKYTWAQIKTHGSKKPGSSVGTGYKLISNHPSLLENIPKQIKLSEMRIDEKKRIFGFRVDAIYYIVWFDRDHSVCPE